MIFETWWNHLRAVTSTGARPLHSSKCEEGEGRIPLRTSKIDPSDFKHFTFARRSHWRLFKGLDLELFGASLKKDDSGLKIYQDLLVFLFLKEHVSSGSRILDVGGGDSRILKYFAQTYDCWNIDKMEGLGNGPTLQQKKGDLPFTLILDYMGSFNSALPVSSFDFVFSISALEHTPEGDPQLFDRILQDIDRVLKPGGYSLHLFDVRFLPDGRFWTNKLVHRIFETTKTMNQWIVPESIMNDPDLYVMSKKAYDKNWLPITKRGYSEFGRPSSLNILWRKPF